MKISIDWLGNVSCVCGKSLNKFYRQNFCYQCFWNSPLASQSIFKPELCTADLGIEERDLDWEKKFQIAPHYVYLANSSGLKVGITRKKLKKLPDGLIKVQVKQFYLQRSQIGDCQA